MNIAHSLPLAGTQIPGTHADAAAVKRALRTLAGGVSVITAGRGEERTGATVTSATGLSMDLACDPAARPVLRQHTH